MNQPTASSVPQAQDSEPKTPPLFTVVCLIIVLWGLYQGRPFLLPVLISGFLAFLMAPFHRILMRRLKFPDALAVIVSAIVFISPLVLLGFLLIQQGRGLVQDVPQLVSTVQTKLQNFVTNDPLAAKLGLDSSSDFGSLIQRMSSSLGAGVGILVGGLAAVADVGSQMILIFVFSILFLGSRVHLRLSAEHILAKNKSLDGTHLLDQSTDLVQKFLVARMTIVVIIGTMGTIALKLLGVKYSIFLGSFFGFLTLVPAVGTLIAILSAAGTAFLTGHSIGSVLLIVAILFGISSIENYYLTPKLVGNRLNLNALTCFIGLFAGGLLWGVWGMFLSVPLIGVMRIVFAAIPSLRPWGELLADKIQGDVLDLSQKEIGKHLKPKAKTKPNPKTAL